MVTMKKYQNPFYRESAVKVNEIISGLHQENYISDKQFQYLKSPDDPRPRIFYLLPKVHKPISTWYNEGTPSGRFIVSDCSSESYAA